LFDAVFGFEGARTFGGREGFVNTDALQAIFAVIPVIRAAANPAL
jgi:hypothetical protein